MPLTCQGLSRSKKALNRLWKGDSACLKAGPWVWSWGFVALFFIVVVGHADAVNTSMTNVVLNIAVGQDPKVEHHEFALLEAALRATEPDFGPFSLKYHSEAFSRNRALREIEKGRPVNIGVSPVKPQWNELLARVDIPVKKGIWSYRVFILLQENKDLLQTVNSPEKLKSIPTGVGAQWAFRKVLEEGGFNNVVTGLSTPNLYKMLSLGRFVTFSRGVEEAARELQEFGADHPGLVIDEHVMLYVYLPSYFYVSPQFPKIAERVRVGLERIFESGEYDEIFKEYVGDVVKEYRLNQRRVFILDNPNLSPKARERDKPYLLPLFDE